jgi:hypothetical protein
MADKKAKPDKGAGKGAGAEPDTTPRLTGHPRARRQIAAAKGWAGLLVLVFVALASHGAGSTWFDALLRGLVLGMVAYLVVWAAGIVIWRRIAQGEMEAVRRRIIAEREERSTGADDAAGTGRPGAQS